jgi:hypothetical protein
MVGRFRLDAFAYLHKQVENPIFSIYQEPGNI